MGSYGPFHITGPGSGQPQRARARAPGSLVPSPPPAGINPTANTCVAGASDRVALVYFEGPDKTFGAEGEPRPEWTFTASAIVDSKSFGGQGTADTLASLHPQPMHIPLARVRRYPFAILFYPFPCSFQVDFHCRNGEHPDAKATIYVQTLKRAHLYCGAFLVPFGPSGGGDTYGDANR
jgi:hypothetical protein